MGHRRGLARLRGPRGPDDVGPARGAGGGGGDRRDLCRAELTELAPSIQSLPRKVIYEEKHPETKQWVSVALASNRKQDGSTRATRKSLASFTDDTAAKTGAHERAGSQSPRESLPRCRPSSLTRRSPTTRATGGPRPYRRPEIQLAVATLLLQGKAKSVSAALKALEPDEQALAPERSQYCPGCAGGGWVAESTYTRAPSETQIPATGRGAKRRSVEATGEVADDCVSAAGPAEVVVPTLERVKTKRGRLGASGRLSREEVGLTPERV